MSEEEFEDETMTDDYSKPWSKKLCGQGQGTSLTGSQAKSRRLPSRQFLAKQKLAILTASKKVHLGQRPKNDGTGKR